MEIQTYRCLSSLDSTVHLSAPDVVTPPAFTITGLNGEALIGDILLSREGEYTVVYVNKQGIWYEAIRELSAGAFSHNITAYGLMHLNKPAEWLSGSGN